MLSNTDNKEFSISSRFYLPARFSSTNHRLLISTPSTLLAWCSYENNEISVIDLETKQNYATFVGARISDIGKYQIL
jgi:hypothetical protein